MGNVFDFDLVANDQFSAVIINIDEAAKKLHPTLDKIQDGLNLGGDESLNKLNKVNDQFESLSKLARDNVQFIGDIVPPLKMVGELGSKYAGMLGKIGVAGAVAAGVGGAAVAAARGLNQAADSAYRLDVSAKNAGMRVDDFSRLAGAMRILGADADSANQSVEGMYKTFNDALQGRNSGVLAMLSQIGVQIVRNADGTANVMKTVEEIAKKYPSLSSQNQKTLADAIGFDDNILMLLREGARLKELLSKSDKFGLTVDPQLNNQLNDVNTTLRELDGAWEGLKQKTKSKIFEGLLSDGSVKDGIEGITDILTNGLDSISLSHFLGATRGKEADQLRWGYNNPEFYKTLSELDKIGLDYGVMTDGYREKYSSWHRPVNAALQLQSDVNAIRVPRAEAVSGSGSVDSNGRSVRNNNPWNLNYAGQRGATIEGGVSDPRFARFPTPEAGVLAADNQLKLYATGASKNVSYPLDNIGDIIRTASPHSDKNDTDGMIRRASEELSVKPNQSLDLSDPVMRSKVLAALFNQEGNNRHSSEQILGIIQGAPNINAPIRSVSTESESQRLVGTPDGRTEIELTIVNDRTGERQQYRAQHGGRITAPLQFP
ncbi:hypothetical protein ABRP56_08940 [Pectobacterium odoriferum]|uniref:hypothetical protein n=1 Tax=Pectobacterium odoriferum TaxID=78398 RepID=UPI0032EAEA08